MAMHYDAQVTTTKRLEDEWNTFRRHTTAILQGPDGFWRADGADDGPHPVAATAGGFNATWHREESTAGEASLNSSMAPAQQKAIRG